MREVSARKEEATMPTRLDSKLMPRPRAVRWRTKTRSCIPVLLGLLTAFWLTCQPVPQAWAVTWCHDYTLLRATNRRQDFNRTGTKQLILWLRKHHYEPFSLTSAAHDPRAQSSLKP